LGIQGNTPVCDVSLCQMWSFDVKGHDRNYRDPREKLTSRSVFQGHRNRHRFLGCLSDFLQEAQLTLTNPRDAFRGQSRSPNIASFHIYARYVQFVFKTRRFYDIRLQKCSDLEIRVRGHSRSSKVVPFDWVWLPITVL